jgi:hypothetical protein
MQILAVSGRLERDPGIFLTQNISNAKVCFPAPRHIEPGESIEVQVTLIGVGENGKDVHVFGSGRFVRVEAGTTDRW